jgi:PAS domain S-box-containing protein
LKRTKISIATFGFVAIFFLLAFASLSYERIHAAEIKEAGVNLERCMSTFRELLMHKGKGFKLENGQLLVGSYVVNGNFDIPDHIQEIFGETATVFMGDVRISTNVLHADGRRAVGTRLEGAAYDAIFKQGKAFRGETLILGLPYLTAYDPIRDANNKIIGVLYVGMKKTEFLAQYSELKIQLVLILLGLLTILTALVIFFDRSMKKAEREKEADNRFLQTLINTIPNPVYYKDVQGKYIGGNKAFTEFLGIPIEQLIGKTVFDLLPPDEANHIHQAESKLYQGNQLLVDETTIASADGPCRDVINYKATFSAEDGSFGGFIGTILDISKHKQIEQALAKQARLASLRAEIGGALGLNLDLQPILKRCAELLVQYLDVAFFRIWTLNEAEQILEMQASAGMYTHIDGPHGRVPVGMFKIGMIASERQPHLTNDVLNDPRIGDKEWARQEKMIAFAGYPLIVADRLVGVMATFARTALNEEILGELGTVAGRIAQCIERKWLEAELKKAMALAEENAQRLAFILEGSNDATWEWDMITSQGFLNTRYYEMIEYTPEEIVFDFAFFLKTIHLDDVSKVQRRLQDYFEGKTDRYEAHYRMVTKSGKLKDVMGRGRIVRYDEEGRPIRMAGLISDVSEKKKLDDELNKIHNLEAIGLLAGGLAHDFNNVLNVIYGNISFAKMLAGGDASIIEPLTDAEEACERSRELGIRLQALAQGNSSVKEPITLPAIIAHVAGTLYKDSNILHTIYAADDLLPVVADPRQIKQVFENLLTNANEAMVAGGTVTIKIENYCVDRRNILHIESGNYVSIALQDSGRGIPEENLPKIFDPYFSTKDTYSQKGLGLGLSICHAILKRHNGHISVESTVGVGTIVTVYLPAS